MKEDRKHISLFFQHHEGSVETVYYQYNKLLKHIAKGILNSEALADDVVQETFLKALSSRDSFTMGSSFTAWICQIAKNLSLNKKKEESRYQPLNEEKMLEVYEPEKPCVTPILDKLKSSLSQEEYDIYIFRAYYQLSFKQISLLLSQEEGPIRSKYHRISKKVKAIFKE